jgi:hypothetical protein
VPEVVVAKIHVNNAPLTMGVWDGIYWTENQDARASNDFLKGDGPTPYPAPGQVTTIRWVIEVRPGSPDDPTRIRFNVCLDLPGRDPILHAGVVSGQSLAYPHPHSPIIAPMLPVSKTAVCATEGDRRVA